MIEIVNKEKCCGCTACYNICPKHCINMKEDFEGFKYPYVDTTLCVDCKLCEKVCPVLSGFAKSEIINTYVVRNCDDCILDESTSGGAFSALALSVAKKGGVVVGAVYTSDGKIQHAMIQNDIDLIQNFRGSKYVQSDLKDLFSKIRKRLDGGIYVLFSGTSCQIAGLKNFLRKDYEKLLTVEVICHGTPSPLLWEKYLVYQKRKIKSDVCSINFRNKTYGYHSGTMKIKFKNGKCYCGSARVDYMLKSFFSEISSRPSCYVCPCKGEERPADISIFDCWHASQLVSGLADDDRGYTNVFINTQKGKDALREAEKYLKIYKTDTGKAIKLDGVMVNNQPKRNNHRDDFYIYLNQHGLQNTIQKYIPVSRKDYIIENSKEFLYKIGIFKAIQKLYKDFKAKKMKS